MSNGFITEPEITQEEFVMIRDFIHEKSGIFFAENKTYLVKNRLIKRMGELGIKSYRDYFYHVKYDTSLKEFNQLMTLITTNETSFYRNEPQLLSFSDEVLPLIMRQKTEAGQPKTLRIWSAGCSTGEEPYTIAMILLEKVGRNSGWKLEIVANDISDNVLQKARRAEYSGITLRNVQPVVLERYFTQVGENYRVNPEVRSLVSFSYLNLNDPRRVSMNNNFDVIFCRNVMIYFSDEVKRQLVRSFFNALVPGGYFYIGHSETLHGISKAFKLVYFKNALVYHKEPVGDAAGQRATKSAAETGLRPLQQQQPDQGVAGTGAKRALDLLSKIKAQQAKV